MARGNFDSLVLNARLDRKKRALQSALLVPWRELAASADEYVEWHMFVLWVRTIIEASRDLPGAIRSELQGRCPGFLDGNEAAKNQPIWKLLDEWITSERFTHANADGWFDAIMYYAYKDLRVEQSWTLWQRAKAEWQRTRPADWPTFDQWKLQTITTRALTEAGTEKARAVAALENVHLDRLQSAVTDVIERRAVVLWADCLSKPDQPIDPMVFAEIPKRCPGGTSIISAISSWRPPTMSRLIRSVEAESRETARREDWYAALRYHVANHPRYQRLLHYRERCHDEWLRVRPISLPSFPSWLASADAYCTARKA